jgi:lipopolysaccharide transport system permease protein
VFVFEPFIKLYKNRNMIFQTAKNDIKARYAGSLLGIIWAMLYPILFLGCYAIMYIYVFNVRFNLFNTNEYVILIFCGLVPFLGFQEAIASGTSCVVANVNLMKNTLFPIELIPVKSVVASQTTQVSGMIMILIAVSALGKFSVFTLLFIVLWILQMMFSLGLVWILSSLNVIFRDIQNMISIVLLLIMMISPIAYPVDMVPQNLKIFLKINPLYYIISSYQDVLMFGRMPKLTTILPFIIMSFGTFIIGYHFFIKMKKVFADNV